MCRNRLLCVTVTAATTAELRQQRDAVADADLIELRLDSVSDPNVAGALAGRRAPVDRHLPARVGRRRLHGSEEERKRILTRGARARRRIRRPRVARALRRPLSRRRGGRRIVLSSHDFDGVPVDLDARVRGDATRPAPRSSRSPRRRQRSATACRCSTLGAQTRPARRPGAHRRWATYGLSTRVLAGRFGSIWTYAGALQRDRPADARSRCSNDYRFRSLADIDGRLRHRRPARSSHSVSPAMHNAAFRAARRRRGLPAAAGGRRRRFRRRSAARSASAAPASRFRSRSSLFDHVDEVDAVARRIGAINTIRVDRRPLDRRQHRRERIPAAAAGARAARRPRARRCSAPAARRARSRVALASSGCAVTRPRAQSARRPRKSPTLDAGRRRRRGRREPGSWDLLINCTPIGMYPRVDETPIAGERSSPGDTSTTSSTTRRSRGCCARRRRPGCQTIGGLDMLVAQAREQFEWWTGIEAAGRRDAARPRSKRLAEFTRDENHVV